MARRFLLKRDEAETQISKLSIDYGQQLNRQQFLAATAGDGPVLIIAGAGTGKTRTLVYRVAFLVETGTLPEHIVLLTFTRRAAREMVERAASLLDGRCRRVRGGTFHSFCLEVLSRHAERLGYPRRFTILDAADAGDVIEVIRTEMGLNRAEKRFPRKDTLRAMISASINRGMSLEEVVTERYGQFSGHLDAITDLALRYASYKRKQGLMDYDDLLEKTLELFERAPDVLNEESARCRCLLVDEYQDTNHLQAALVERLVTVHGNITAVGDDAQSIYGFRGADYRNIFHFAERFQGTEVCKLEHNYRSTQPILDVANQIIRQAGQRFEKTLRTERTEGEPPAVVPAPNERFEARFVAQVILSLREEGVPLNRIAVLFRSAHNSYELELELQRRDIPFVKYGGTKLMEAAHIKDVIGFLRVLENPADTVAWYRILQLIEGVGARTAQAIVERLQGQAGDPEHPFQPGRARYAEQLASMFKMLNAASMGESLSAELELILDFYYPLMERIYSEDFPRRRQDIDHFTGIAGAHDSRSRLLAAMALEPLEISALEAEASQADEPPLVLSTIHSAKGLEFHTVFVIHLVDGVLPSSYSLKDAHGADEELRLLYVAVTRAEENLFLSYPVTQDYRRDADLMTRPSRFLDPLEEPTIELWQLEEERSTPPMLPPGR
jgi:DNA helicase II / ATP-dependent DNA helicase PcrA